MFMLVKVFQNNIFSYFDESSFKETLALVFFILINWKEANKMTQKSISQIETIVDQNIENLKIYNYDTRSVILFLCQLFERRVNNIKKINHILTEIIPVEFAVFGINSITSFREKILDEHEALSLLVREVMKRDGIKEQLECLEDREIIQIGNEAFERALEQIRAESLFTSMHRGLFSGTVISDKESKECIRFTYKNSEIAFYEAINAQILNDYNMTKRINYMSPEELGIRKFNPWTFIKIRHNANKWMDADFQLPNDYQIGPYKIREIKEVWAYVITKAYIEYYSNLSKELPTLMELNYKAWRYTYTSMEVAGKLINDLTYKGEKHKKNTKNKFIYTTLLTEPILEIDGKKLISPTLILNYQASRNIISTLNRIYEGHPEFDSSIHSDRKEGIFTSELIDSLSNYNNFKFSSSIGITKPVKTDVDFAIYDTNSMTLACFELKWLNEPVTAVEIHNKDKELTKAISIQLPNYKLGIEDNIDEFIIKAFKEKFIVKKIYYFVLTKGTIGSGDIKRDKYQIINQRMLIKALYDYKGDLVKALEMLKGNYYQPKDGKHFELVSDIQIKVGDVTLLSDGHRILKAYSLRL